MKDILVAQGKNVIMSKARIESREQVLRQVPSLTLMSHVWRAELE